VLAHVLNYGAIRREALASVLTELGAELSIGDPIEWERANSRRIAQVMPERSR
jgi:AraC family transcriptional regulator